MQLFERICPDFDLSAFRQTYSGKSHWHLPNQIKEEGSFFSRNDVNDLISYSYQFIGYPEILLVKDGAILPKNSYSVSDDKKQRKLSIPKLKELFKNGCTIKLKAAERFSKLLRELSEEFKSEFNCDVTINIYISNSIAKGFDKHYDTHDLFVLQVEGEKGWDLFGITVASPLEREKSSLVADSHIPPSTKESVLLKKGDFLYIPKGMWHYTQTIGNQSIHLAIGLKDRRLLDAILWILNNKPVSQLFKESLLHYNSGELPDLDNIIDKDNLRQYIQEFDQSQFAENQLQNFYL